MPAIFKFIFLPFLIMPLLVKSQDTKDVFLSIGKQAAAIESTLENMNASIKKDKHKESEQLAHDIETALTAIDKQSNALPLLNRQRVLSITDSFKTDLKSFEKLVHKSGLFDNDKALAAAFAPLKNRIGTLREYLRTTYSALVVATENTHGTRPAIDTADKSIAHTPTTQSAPVQVQVVRPVKAIEAPAITIASPTTNTPLETGADNNKNESIQPAIGTSSPGDMNVLNNIRQAQQQIGKWIDQLRLPVKNSQSDKIRTLSKSIMTSAAKIQDLTMLLKDDRSDNVSKLAGGLVEYATKLQALLLKGHSAHEQMHQTLELMETRFNVLSTGISMLK